MDFETLGEELVRDTLEDSEIYEKISAAEVTHKASKSDFEKAKGFLSTVNSKLNISLYDHLADVLQTILRSKIPNAVEKFEELSSQVKNIRLKGDSTLTEVFEIGEDLQAYIKEKQIFYKFITAAPDISEAIKTADEDEEESDEDEDDEKEPDLEDEPDPVDLSEVLPDIHYAMGRFGQAGIGLSTEEVHDVILALKDLALQYKLKKVRFWGKVFGISSDYYVAESPYQEGLTQENFGWGSGAEPEVEPEDEKELEEKENEDVDEEENKEETEESEEPSESEAVKIPPIPEPKSKPRKKIPAEANGTGVNEHVYFACTKIGHPWRVLPFMMPSHVSEARYLKRFFKGDFETQIRGSVPYPGTEAHYLRAQIARITASTYIAPAHYYKLAGEKDEEDEAEDDEEADAHSIVPNPEFVPRSAKKLHSKGLSAWVHYRRAILDQGRCTPMKLEKGDDDEDNDAEGKEDEEDDENEAEEEEEPEILEAIVENEVPMLRSISEDRGIARLKTWTLKLSSQLIEETAVLVLHSSLWPGAYTFYDGKSFEHIYIGYGCKFSVFHYVPPIRVSWQREYAVGADVIEHVDEEILPAEAEDDEKNDEEDDEKNDEENGEENEDDEAGEEPEEDED